MSWWYEPKFKPGVGTWKCEACGWESPCRHEDVVRACVAHIHVMKLGPWHERKRDAIRDAEVKRTMREVEASFGQALKERAASQTQSARKWATNVLLEPRRNPDRAGGRRPRRSPIAA